uniref:Poly [ADP-ribose] polymerase n=1 Tax=Sparus aurata TaxID=8175 RepID=A0A671UH22_SPAAU
INTILTSCEERGFGSIALPVLGAGIALRFPDSVVAKVLLEEVHEFEQNRNSRTPMLINIVIHPNDDDSCEVMTNTFSVRYFLSPSGKENILRVANSQKCLILQNQPHVARQNLTSGATFAEGGTTVASYSLLDGLQVLVCQGDITKLGADALVNAANEDLDHGGGVAAALSKAGGPQVQKESRALVKQAGKIATGDVVVTTGGNLNCKKLLHAVGPVAGKSGGRERALLEKTVQSALNLAEMFELESIAIPCISSGLFGVPVDLSMLDGMTSAITDVKPKSVSLIRIVILQQQVFQAFRSHINLTHAVTEGTSTTSAPQDATFLSFKPLPAVINVIACSRDTIRTVGRDLEGILQKQLVEREVDVHNFSRLEAMEVEAVQAKVRLLEISLEYKRSGNAARDRSVSGVDVYVLKGLKEDVLSVIELVNKAVQEALCEDLQSKEEAMLALNVQWLIQKVNGDWQELSLHDNFLLEEAHLKKQVSVDVTNIQGLTLTCVTSSLALEIPTHWDPMRDELFKKVQLQPNSTEYQHVAQGFLKMANYNIQKIERVQNFYLWNAYAVCRQRILAKNGQADLGEKFLYHGTSAESCNLIERDRFDRSYAGTHAAAYGKGVYFAVDANYSAGGFSPADTAGLKRLYVARVLTGRYTVGNRDMKSPPPRGADPTDCFDSVVNNQQPPSMFVIFHDDQAYPEYLITFR